MLAFHGYEVAAACSGEEGVRNDAQLEKLYRDVKILDIGEGTQQVQRLVIARQLFGLPREA